MPTTLRFLALTVIAAMAFSVAAPEGREQRFEIDEAEWLTISIETARQAFGEASPFDGIPPSPYRDEAGNPWKVGIHQSTFGYMNPLLPKLVFGGVSVALSHDQYDPAVFPRFAKELRPGRSERARGAVYPPLPAVRKVLLLLASVSAALLFLIAQRLGGTLAGVFSFALFLGSPVVADHATRIRTDFFPIALTLLALWIALRSTSALGGTSGRPAQLRSVLALGLLAGLAVGSKLNGALLSLMVGVWLLLLWLEHRRQSESSFARGVLLPWSLAAAVAVALFLLFSPHLWPAPVENLGALFEAWDGDIAHQKDQYGERLGRADSIGEHLSLSAKAVGGEYEPLHALTGLPLGWPLVLIGLGLLGYALTRPGERRDALLVLVYVLVAGLGTALWLPFGRDNFYLGFAPVVALLEGLALGAPFVIWRKSRAPASTDSPVLDAPA